MSKSKNIKAEDKIRIAKAYTQGRIGLSEAAKQVGVHHATIEDWVRQYETEGAQAFLPRKGNRRYDPILKEAAVKDYLLGKGRCQYQSAPFDTLCDPGFPLHPSFPGRKWQNVPIAVLALAL